MKRATGRRLAALCIAAASLTACNLVSGVVTTGPISQQRAEDAARFGAGVSVAPIDLVSSRMSTYGAEHPGGSLATPDAAVWVVTLSGGFPDTGCTVTTGFGSFGAFGSPRPTRTCRPPSPTERVLVDATTAQVIDVLVP